MNLLVNSIIEWNDNGRVDRILYSNGEIVVLIGIFEKKGMPSLHRYEEIESSFLSKNFRILENDPFSQYLIPDSEIPDKHKERRDEAYELIQELIQLPNLGILDPQSRGKLVSKLASKQRKPKKTIYRYLAKYWRGGLTKNALLPRFKNCGARGKPKTIKSAGVKKLGRWSNLSKATGENHGIPVTSEVKTYFRRGLRKFYRDSKKMSLKLAFQRTLETYFHIGYEFKGDIKVPIFDFEKLPSFNQFRYYFETEYRNPVKDTKARQGEINFQLKYREILGNSTDMAFGPGSLYQIDATLVDLYLVSSFDRTKIIGRPVLYLIVDVFSRMITGMAVLLEGPSWLGAMLALDNTMSNKVEFCAEYGVEINSTQWDCPYLPRAILADRGEFEGYNANTLVSSLGIVIHNTAPYRGDLKGIVERQFRILNDKFIHFEPGAVIKNRERGEKDYRLDAVLTINEFRAIMIAHILTHNHSQYLEKYHKDEFMIGDQVERFPIDLWNWGLQNKIGNLRTLPRDAVRMNVLPRKEISITSQGLHFEKELYYSCDPLFKQGLMMRRRGRKLPKVNIAYDPRNTDYIYLPSLDNQNVTVCPLTPAAKNMKGRDLYDVQFYFHEETQAAERSQPRQIKSQSDFHAINDHITQNALEKAEEAHYDAGDIPNSHKVRGIRENRANDRELDRQNNSWEFDKGDSNNKNQPTNNQAENTVIEEEEHIVPISHANRIRKIRNQKKGDKNE